MVERKLLSKNMRKLFNTIYDIVSDLFVALVIVAFIWFIFSEGIYF